MKPMLVHVEDESTAATDPGFLSQLTRRVARGVRSVDSVDWKDVLATRLRVRSEEAEREVYWAKLRPWIWTVGGLLIAAVMICAFLFLPVFRVQTVKVTGAQRATPAELQRIAGADGKHVLGVNTAEIENGIALLPWVESVEVKRSLPATVEIKVEEREPTAFLDAVPPVAVDADGVVLGTLADLDRLLFPTLAPDGDVPPAGDVWQDEDGRIVLGAIGALTPEARAKLESAALGERGVQAKVRAGPDVYFGDPVDMAVKGEVLLDVLAGLYDGGGDIRYIDVSSPTAPSTG